jgi:hypothetical protein
MVRDYSERELNNVYMSLTEEQKTVLDEYVRRGKKTKWLNTWAKKKGQVLSEEELANPDLAMDELLEWVLVNYEDALAVDSNLLCECGRAYKI